MKVKELIKILQKVDGDKKVYISIDPEGNAYNLLSDWEEMVYHEGQVYYPKLTEELKKQGYTDDDVYQGETSIILWP